MDYYDILLQLFAFIVLTSILGKLLEESSVLFCEVAGRFASHPKSFVTELTDCWWFKILKTLGLGGVWAVDPNPIGYSHLQTKFCLVFFFLHQGSTNKAKQIKTNI